MNRKFTVERSATGRIMAIYGKPLKEIAEECGLQQPEVSMALGGRRLLGRDKLEQVVKAGYPVELFVFGVDWYEKKQRRKKCYLKHLGRSPKCHLALEAQR